MRVAHNHHSQIGSRVALLSILGEVESSIIKISEIVAAPGSKIDEIKLFLNALEFSEDGEWVFEKLEKLISLLSNVTVRSDLAEQKISEEESQSLLNAMKRACACFEPYVTQGKNLGKIGAARANSSATFQMGFQKNQQQDDTFYFELNKLLNRVEGRETYYQGKAKNNPMKRHVLRLLDNFVKFRLPKTYVWISLLALLWVSEKNSKARQIFCQFYNDHFLGFVGGESLPEIPLSFKEDDENKEIQEGYIIKILERFKPLIQKYEDFRAFRFRFLSLLKIVFYDDTLDLGSSSFCHYTKMGEKKGRTTNRGKRSAARALFYNLITGARISSDLMAMSRFVLHTDANSRGEEFFKDFYLHSCAEYFSDHLQLNAHNILEMRTPIDFSDDLIAYQVLYACVHSLILANDRVFKKELLEGDADTLKDLAAGLPSKKPLKCALIKLKLTVERGSELSQLVRVIQDVVAARAKHPASDEYSKVGDEIVRLFERYLKERPIEKEDIQEYGFLKEFENLYTGKDQASIRMVVDKSAINKSKKLAQYFANLKIKIEHAPKEEIFFTLAKLLKDFGKEIQAHSSELYEQLKLHLLRLSHDYRIHLVGDDLQLAYVPECWVYDAGKYILGELQISFPENEKLMSHLVGELGKAINVNFDPGFSIGVNLLDPFQINLKFGNEPGASVLLQIILKNEGENAQLYLRPFVSELDNSGNANVSPRSQSKFAHLEYSKQNKILNGVADALRHTFREQGQLTPDLEKAIAKISTAADFLEVISPFEKSAQKAETKEGVSARRPSLLERFSGRRNSAAQSSEANSNNSPSLSRATKNVVGLFSRSSRKDVSDANSTSEMVEQTNNKKGSEKSVPSDLPPPPSLNTHFK